MTVTEGVADQKLKIGELAKRAGVTTRTLRYWEEIGLLSPSRHGESSERLYTEDEVDRVKHIRELQDLLGLTLAEIHVVLDSEDALERARRAYRAGATAAKRLRLLSDSLEANAHLIERMDDRLARITAFRNEWVARSERMRGRSAELKDIISPDT